MFRYAVMTCSLLVHHMFDKMTVMVRLGQVKYLIQYCMFSIFIKLLIILDSLMKLWEVVWRLAWNCSSDLGTASTE